jgi:hypothetical protein
MDTIRLFLRTNSFRNSPKKLEENNCSSSSQLAPAINSKKNQRSHSWNVQRNISFPSSLRRTKSFYYSNRIRKVQTDIIRHRIVEVNRSENSVSLPLTTNINNQSVSFTAKQISIGKTTNTNAFLTAASIFKYWVHLSQSICFF